MPLPGRGAFPSSVPPSSTSYREPTEASRSFGTSSSNPNLKGNARIAEYRVLKGLPRADEALAMLRRVGAIVKPIMVRHGWHVPLLVEFSGFQKRPPELLGMNVNRGQKIFLRLRHPLYSSRDPSNGQPTMSDSFLPEDDVVYTMLHELTHNVHGPHDDKFNALLKDLEQEWFEQRRTGGRGYMPGDGFLTPGLRLGMGQLGNAETPAEARRQAAAMAEERRRKQLLGVGGGRLGGGEGVAVDKDAATLAREAAERRRRLQEVDKKAGGGGGVCPSTQSGREEAIKWHEEEELLHGIKVITIEDDSDDEEEVQVIEKPGRGPSTTDEPDAKGIGSSKHDTAGPVLPAKGTAVKEEGAGSTKGKSMGSSKAIVIDDDDDEEGEDDFSTISVKRVKRAPSTTAKANGVVKTSSRLNGTTIASPFATASGPSSSAAAALALQRMQTKRNTSSANDTGWRCSACRQWMGGDKASLWICTRCGSVARK